MIMVGCVMESNVNEMFGKKLKLLIKKVGLTQKKFGEELGVTKNKVYYWCKGKYIRLEDINKIIKYFLFSDNIYVEKFSPLWLLAPEICNETFDFPIETEIERLKTQYRKDNLDSLRSEKQKFDLKISVVTSKNEELSKKNYILKQKLETMEETYSKKLKKELDKREETYKKEVEKKLLRDRKLWCGIDLTNKLLSDENIKKVIDSLIKNSNGTDINSEDFKSEIAVTVSKILSKYLIEEYIKILDK